MLLKGHLAIFFTVLTPATMLYSQYLGRGPGSMALANIVSVSDNYPATSSGIAALGLIDKNFWESSMHIPFGLVDIASYNMGWAFKGKLPFSLSLEHAGSNGFREDRLSVGVANRWGRLDVGFRIHMHRLSLIAMQHTGLNLEFGFRLNINRQVRIGLNLMNPSRQELDDRTLPGHLFMGIHIQALSFLRVLLEVGQEHHRPLVFRWGMEATLYKKISLRTGYDFLINSITGGIGWSLNQWAFDYAAALHQNLGLSHQWTFQLTW